jgi:hypothetical protein
MFPTPDEERPRCRERRGDAHDDHREGDAANERRKPVRKKRAGSPLAPPLDGHGDDARDDAACWLIRNGSVWKTPPMNVPARDRPRPRVRGR